MMGGKKMISLILMKKQLNFISAKRMIERIEKEIKAANS